MVFLQHLQVPRLASVTFTGLHLAINKSVCAQADKYNNISMFTLCSCVCAALINACLVCTERSSVSYAFL